MLIGVLGLFAVTAAQASDSTWWQRQAALEVASLTGQLATDTFGNAGSDGPVLSESSQGHSPAVPMLLSLLVPGAGEVYLGKKIGFLFMAGDLFSWYEVIHNTSVGNDKRDEYYVYAQQHWFEDKLDAAYDPNYLDRADANLAYTDVVDVGHDYFSDFPVGYQNIPLWVSSIADRREYFENLGKWDQFVFGWDDFRNPTTFLDGIDPDPIYLKDPRTSEHRETYRAMRRDSNNAFDRRDRFIYVSLALRVASVLHVAYLEGLLFGDGGANSGNDLQVAGHPVQIFAEPVGRSAGIVGASLSF